MSAESLIRARMLVIDEAGEKRQDREIGVVVVIHHVGTQPGVPDARASSSCVATGASVLPAWPARSARGAEYLSLWPEGEAIRLEIGIEVVDGLAEDVGECRSPVGRR
jgi:hypothetical protein